MFSGLPLNFNGVHFPEFIDLLWYLKFVQHVGNDILELLSLLLGAFGLTGIKFGKGKLDRQLV